MTTPEPLDEAPAGGVEQRGGNSPVDYILESFTVPASEAQHACGHLGAGCDCDCEEPA